MTTAAVDTPPAFDWKSPQYDPIFRERMERLERIRKDPALVEGLKAFYKDHPVEFIDDWGCTYDPRNAQIGLPTLIPFRLFDKQQEFVQWLLDLWRSCEDGLVEKSRDMGVSWICVAFSCWLWRFHPGAAIGFGSRKEEYVDDLREPKSLFWKARKFIDCLPVEFRPAGWVEKKHAPYMKLVNPENEAIIFGEAGDNIGRGARASLYFVDEAAFLERPEITDAALSQTTKCRIDVSTPNGAGNSFYRKRHGGKIKVFVFDWRDDPRKDQAWYDAECLRLDPVVVAAEIDRNYEASVTNALIDAPRVDAAMRRSLVEVQPMGRLRVGLDPARFGDDQTALAIRRGRALLKLLRMRKADAVQVVSRVHMELSAFRERPEQIAVDTCGLGGPIADMLRAYYPDEVVNPHYQRFGRKVVVDVNASIRMDNGQHYNLRAFMWSQMKDWLESAVLPNDPDLRVDLTAIRYEFRKGELLLEPKEDMKERIGRSPDGGDAVALTFAIPSLPEPELPRAQPFQPLDRGMGAL